MSHYVAQPYVSGSPNSEIQGVSMTSLIDNVEADMVAPLLAKHGLANPDLTSWHPFQTWLNVLKDLGNALGSSNAYIAIGRRAVENVILAPEVNSIPTVLPLLQIIYGVYIRNTPEGEGYFIEKKGETQYWMYHNTPHPDDLIYGYIWGLVARFKKPDEHFIVRILPNPHPEIHAGTVFEVKWGPKTESLA